MSYDSILLFYKTAKIKETNSQQFTYQISLLHAGLKGGIPAYE